MGLKIGDVVRPRSLADARHCNVPEHAELTVVRVNRATSDSEPLVFVEYKGEELEESFFEYRFERTSREDSRTNANPFQKGDLVRCVDDDRSHDKLSAGRTYTVHAASTHYVAIKEGDIPNWYHERFELVSRTQPTPLVSEAEFLNQLKPYEREYHDKQLPERRADYLKWLVAESGRYPGVKLVLHSGANTGRWSAKTPYSVTEHCAELKKAARYYEKTRRPVASTLMGLRDRRVLL